MNLERPIDFPHQVDNRLGDEMFPRLARGHAAANLTRRNIVKVRRQRERMNMRSQMIRRVIRALPVRHQQMHLLENPLEGAGVVGSPSGHIGPPSGLVVIPCDHTLGGIASADDKDFRVRPRSPDLARDIDEQAAIRDLDTGFA